jgi:hypothetical protein
MARTASSLALLLGLVFATPAFADPVIQTFTVSVPNPMPVLAPGTAPYNLTIEYVFTQEDLLNAAIEIDLPPDLLLIDVGDTTPFAANCLPQANPDVDPTYDWRCTLTASRVNVGAGVSGTIVLRVKPAAFAFESGETLTVTASLSASNLPSPVDASFQTTLTTTAPALYDSPSTYNIGTVEAPFLDGANLAIGISSILNRSLYNTSTAFVGRNVEARTRFTGGTGHYYLGQRYQGGWVPQQSAWDPLTTIVMTLPRLLGPAYVGAVSSLTGQRATENGGSANYEPIIWSPCDDVARAASLTAETWTPVSKSDPTLQLTNAGQATAFTDTGVTNPYYHFDCDAGTEGAANAHNLVVGGSVSSDLVFALPMGAVPLYDLFVAVKLDPQVPYANYSAYSYYHSSGVTYPIDLYLCDFDSGTVDLDRFLTERDVHCELLGESSYYEETPRTGLSYLIAYSPEYAVEEPWGRTVNRYLGISAGGTIPCALAGAEIHYEGMLSARRAPGGPLLSTPWYQQTDLVNDQVQFYADGPYFQTDPGSGLNLSSVNRNQTFAINAYLYNNPYGKNPTGTIILPPGLRLVTSLWLDAAYYGDTETACESPRVTVSETTLPDGSTEIEMRLRATNGPNWFYVANCESTDCVPSGNGQPAFVVYVDPAYPWRDGDMAAVSMDWTSENSPYESYPTTQSIRVNVPDQQRLVIEPICDGQGTGDCTPTSSEGRTPGLRVTMQNRSGRDLTDLVAVVQIPRIGDGAGTEVDTQLASIQNPAGLTIECLASGTWSSICDANAEAVRALATSIAPLAEVAFTVLLDLDPAASTGAKAYGRGSLVSNELAEVPSASVSPIRVNRCPGSLIADVWFDANQNGLHDAGEPYLADWFFDFEDDLGGTSTFEVDFSGHLEALLANGLYAWTVQKGGTPTEGTFRVVGNPAPEFAICADQVTTLGVPVTCDCPSYGGCYVGTCDFLGHCTYNYDPSAGTPDNNCNGFDDDCDGSVDEDFVPYATTCTSGGCSGTGQMTCRFGQLQNSCTVPVPTQEVCDGKDNDCDGLVDAQDWKMQIEPCEEQRGVCQFAYKSLDLCYSYSYTVNGTTYTNGYWLACQTRDYLLNAYNYFGSYDPATGTYTPGRYVEPQYQGDTCDGYDNDCDGSVDENFASSAVDCGCGTTGSTTCDGGLVIPQCGPIEGSGEEICDGIDNDCDGLVDQADPDLLIPDCESTQGVCANRKKPSSLCTGLTGWSPCGPADYATAAYPDYRLDNDCDGQDNDCDGVPDDDFEERLVECSGGCSPVGTVACVDGQPVDTCQGGSAAPELCDGIDNDCDGLVDAADPDLFVPLCENQQGVCDGSRKPISLCTSTGWLPCQARDYAANAFPVYALNDQVCDGLDNDCDGQVDEEYVGALRLCPVDSCQPVARDRCTGTPPEITSGCEPTRPGCATDPSDCESCDPDNVLVVYGVAEDANGVARGSFRCTRTLAGLACDTDPDGSLHLSDNLWCGQ